jgi:hypothetical protein
MTRRTAIPASERKIAAAFKTAVRRARRCLIEGVEASGRERLDRPILSAERWVE